MAVHREDPQRELQKLHMLQAMGLRLYLPRYRLPGAAPSRVIPWGKAAAPASSPATAQGASNTAVPDATAPSHTAVPGTRIQDSHAANPPGAAAHRLLEPEHRLPHAAPRIVVDATAPAATVDTHTPPAQERPAVRATAAPGTDTPTAPAASTASATSDPMARFQALLLPLAGPVAVLALVPAVARLQLPERERRLLQGILHWLGVSEAATQAPRPFQWPLPGLLEASAAQAGVSLHAFLDQARRELGFAHLLIFGEPLQTALGTAAADQGMVATYSLQQMTTVPALKRECWLALQPLQRALADGRQ